MATSTVDSSNDGSDEQQRDNYIKYYCLLSEVATETLRNLFQKEIKMHDLRAYFEREPRVLRGLFESQRAILNAQPLPDISQFDISLMAVLFRNRAIFPRLQHYASGPDSLMAQIQILSSIRNDIAHIGDRVHIPTSEFKRHWDELVYVILKIAIDVGQESTAKATKGIAKLEHKTWATEEQQSILHRIKYDQSHIITEITELSTRLANLDSSLENMRMQVILVYQNCYYISSLGYRI